MRNRINKVKEWMKDHPDETYAAAIVAFGLSLFTASVMLERNHRNKRIADMIMADDMAAERTAQALKDGKTVLQDAYGFMWIVHEPQTV